MGSGRTEDQGPSRALGPGSLALAEEMVSPEAKLVHGNGEVAGLVTTAVQVAVVHGHQVHVTKDEAVVGSVLLQRLQEAHIEQLGPVEGVLAVLGMEVGDRSAVGLGPASTSHLTSP